MCPIHTRRSVADLTNKALEEASNTATLFANVTETTASIAATASERAEEIQREVDARLGRLQSDLADAVGTLQGRVAVLEKDPPISEAKLRSISAEGTASGGEGATSHAALSASLRALEDKVSSLQDRVASAGGEPWNSQPSGVGDIARTAATESSGGSNPPGASDARLSQVSSQLSGLQDRLSSLEELIHQIQGDPSRSTLQGPPSSSSVPSAPSSKDGAGSSRESVAAVRAWAEPQIKEIQASLTRLSKSAKQDLEREIAAVKTMISDESAMR